MESPSSKSNSVAMSSSSSKNHEDENHASNPENSSSSVEAIPPIVPRAHEPLESKNHEEENHASNPENSSSSVEAIPPIVPRAHEPLESENHEEENHASNPENSSSSVEAIPPIVPRAHEPLEHLDVANANEFHYYGCTYCDKRFSNKQALGGHQNAHKTERAIEKNAYELRRNQFAYLSGASYPVMASHPTFTGPFNYRPMINRPYMSQQPVHHGVHIGHYAPPLLPMVPHPYAPRALYPRWDTQMPRVSQYMEPPSHGQYNPGFAPVGMGYSSARPVSEAHPNFTNSRLVPGRDPGNQHNNQMNNPQNQEDEDSDLDLTLRL